MEIFPYIGKPEPYPPPSLFLRNMGELGIIFLFQMLILKVSLDEVIVRKVVRVGSQRTSAAPTRARNKKPHPLMFRLNKC